MLPEPSEDEQRQNTLSSMITTDKRRSTIDSVLHKAVAARSPSVISPRDSESIVRSNPWEEGKRHSTVGGNRKESRKTSSIPGQLLELGRGLICESEKLMYDW